MDAKTLAPTGLRSFVVHEEPRMVAVPQFLSPEECLGPWWGSSPGKNPGKPGEIRVFTMVFAMGIQGDLSMKNGECT